MEILTLIIKEKHLDDIVAGIKKEETRDPRPNTFGKYYAYDDAGNMTGPKHYDAIQFYAGYETNRKAALVTISGSELIVWVDDETNEDITYLHKGVEYVATSIEYALNKVVSKQNY